VVKLGDEGGNEKRGFGADKKRRLNPRRQGGGVDGGSQKMVSDEKPLRPAVITVHFCTVVYYCAASAF
jgi:hypothetical protein